MQVASDHPGVLSSPTADVLFLEFGDSALVLVLRFWTRDYSNRLGVIQSDLNFSILNEFRKRKINIPFPQIDVHMKPKT